jgi:hypothetical protein
MFDIDHHFTNPSVFSSSLAAQVALFIGVVCSIIFGVSQRGGDFIISMISLLLWLAFQRRNGSIDAAQENIRAKIPHRIEDVLKVFNLDGHTTTYAMCPSCHKGYAPQFKLSSSIPYYPQYCVNEILEHRVCGEALLDRDKPILPFIYHHLNDYIGSLLSQKGIELELDLPCDDPMESIAANNDPPTFVHNIFEAEFMRTFRGPDGNHLFVYCQGECHLAFSLCIDFFNVGGLHTYMGSNSLFWDHCISVFEPSFSPTVLT